jgi:3-dehydroquinate synthase
MINNIKLSDQLKNDNVYIGEMGYEYINNILTKTFHNQKKFLLLDENIKHYCLNNLYAKCENLKHINIIKINTGEKYKNISTCIYIWKQLNKYKATRNSLLINIGGGVITDIGGFVGSVFQRGIKFINIPTTLLGMIDASIGGKNGIDFYDLKNYIGTFCNPLFVVVDFSYLRTLNTREFLSGFAELIKYALIYDINLWNNLLKLDIKDNINIYYNNSIDKYMLQAIFIKNTIINKDPKEQGLRKILNFGHTIGHAIETYFLNNKNYLLHGEAIALGMICESWLSYKLHRISYTDYSNIYSFINKLFINNNIKNNIHSMTIEDILSLITYDKKNYNDKKLNFSLLNKIGACNYDNLLNFDIVKESLIKLKYYINL